MIEIIQTKVCSRCGRELPATEEFFYRHCWYVDGFRNQCKECVREYCDMNRDKISQYKQEYYVSHKDYQSLNEKTDAWLLKFETITHYGGHCVVCGEPCLTFLCLDHINNDGHDHRINMGLGQAFYLSLKRNGFPGGLQVLCWNCNWLKHLSFIRQNPSTSKSAMYSRRSRVKIKETVLTHYGHACVCCGITDSDLLCFDHIHNDGAAFRAETIRGPIGPWLIRNDFPDDIQLMCFNCNDGRRINGGICPHN